MTRTILVTGSSGFIGGQTVLALHDAGHKVIGIDNRSAPATIRQALTHVCVSDFADAGALDFIAMHKPSAIVHCAGSSLVGPSVKDPEIYYHNNFVKTKAMLDYVVANKLDIRIVFSSSASVYGEPIVIPCREQDPPLPLSPYGESKLMVEMMLRSYARAYDLDYVIFRYFNACGADSAARHGQEPGATHIIARVMESIVAGQPFVLYGDNYPTPDGTCIRDYVHVEDIANAHSIATVDRSIPRGTYNLGTNQGVSNKQILDIAQKVTGKKVQLTVGAIREGDPAELTAAADKFNSLSPGWARYNLHDMVKHAWTWYNK